MASGITAQAPRSQPRIHARELSRGAAQRESGVVGPALSTEYLWVTRNEQAVFALTAGRFVRYGL